MDRPILWIASSLDDLRAYVLHAFEKPSRKTPARDIQVARDRLREVLVTRRRVR